MSQIDMNADQVERLKLILKALDSDATGLRIRQESRSGKTAMVEVTSLGNRSRQQRWQVRPTGSLA